ncbi:hypothetical protein [Streptosporangium sandarakinum]|uniref:hypothetical protein n=1 Tax=Streptosporangium sandarakinum TaxID=1260955 RepID=UPI00371C02E6
MRKHLVPALLLAAMASLSACSATTPHAAAQPQTPTSAAAERTGSLKVSLLRVSESDYKVYDTPESMAAARPIVVAGVIDGWQQGPAIESYPGGPLEYRVVLRVQITEPLKGVRGRSSIAGNLIYIALDQGAVIRDDALPAEQWKPEKSVADFEKALPTGTKILAFPREIPSTAIGAIRIAGQALPQGARLMTVPPQGLVLEDPGLAAQRTGNQSALVGGREPLRAGGVAWTEPKNLSELVARLKQHGISE